jgi:hypothetical protein
MTAHPSTAAAVLSRRALVWWTMDRNACHVAVALGCFLYGVCGRSDWDRIHALVDPGCAGLPRLIRKYNACFPNGSTARLEDPDRTLAIPCFAA